MAISSSFGAGVLTLTGDALDNTIQASRDAAGAILINGGAVVTQGGPPTIANTSVMNIAGNDGADTITLSETNGALPSGFDLRVASAKTRSASTAPLRASVSSAPGRRNRTCWFPMTARARSIRTASSLST